LGVATSTHGGGHLDGSPHPTAWNGHEELAQQLFGNPRPGAPGEYANQAQAIIWHENYKAVIDMLGICYYTSQWPDAQALTVEDYAAMLSTGSGQEYTADDLMRRGQQLHNLQKAFNTLHTGSTREHERMPRRMGEPIQRGPFKGERIEPEKWESMLDEYYLAQGWDLETGWQTEASLRALDLEEVISKLRQYDRLR